MRCIHRLEKGKKKRMENLDSVCSGTPTLSRDLDSCIATELGLELTPAGSPGASIRENCPIPRKGNRKKALTNSSKGEIMGLVGYFLFLWIMTSGTITDARERK